MPDGFSICVGGEWYALKRVPGAPRAYVQTWHDTGVQFRAREGFNKRRRQIVNLCVWHWTGSENEALAMARTLKRRKLGVEFAIDRDGTITQFCDPLDVDTADAGNVNARSVGVEVVNYGVKSWDRVWQVPKRGTDRAVTPQTIHGRDVQVASFYPVQLAAAKQLADTLSRALPIPQRVPTDTVGRVVDHALPAECLAAFRGHVGHYHVTRAKLDPGPAFMSSLALHFLDDREETLS